MWRKFKNKYIGDKDFYKHIMYLAIPMIIQNAITSFVSFLDNMMVGRIGTEQMTGVAIVNQLIFVFSICIFGGVSGAGIFGTQYYGNGDYKGQKYAFRFKMYICLLITAVAALLFKFYGRNLISLYLNDSGDVGNIDIALKYGEEYLAVIIIGLIPFAIAQAYINSIRETGHTLVPMIAGVVAVAVNLLLDIVLIFGYLGCPKMGVVGAAIATVIARYVECIIVILWTHFNKDKNKFIEGAYKSPYIPKKVLKNIIIKGTPLMVNELLWATGMTVIVQCYAVRGLEVVAAVNISSTITNLFNIVYIQLGSCIAIVAGQLLGAGKVEKAKDSVHKMLFFSVACCAVVALMMIAVGQYFPNLYKTEDVIKKLATNFIIVSAAVMPLCAYSHGAYFTLRSGGKTVITFLFDSVYTWVIMIPIAFLLANKTVLPITAVFFLVQFTEIFKVIIGHFMIRSEIWIQNIVN